MYRLCFILLYRYRFHHRVSSTHILVSSGLGLAGCFNLLVTCEQTEQSVLLFFM